MGHAGNAVPVARQVGRAGDQLEAERVAQAATHRHAPDQRSHGAVAHQGRRVGNRVHRDDGRNALRVGFD
ncbi:hypothetical protein RZS08_32540, partial [Arthrospira platensis SPKY1]|nr:hypothetical protein [Arthrospira platensis SPKY1]